MGTFTSPDNVNVNLQLEVADEDSKRSYGLMGRKELSPGHGMMFVFDAPQELGFWMKNTLIPLDILFFDENGVFVSRTTMDPCTTETCPSYPSNGLSKYAVEVNKNEPLSAPVGEGWTIDLNDVK